MADGRELPDDAGTRRSSGEPPTVIRPSGGIGPFAGETETPRGRRSPRDTPSGGTQPTDSPATPVGKYDGPGTGGTQAIYSAAEPGDQKAAPAQAEKSTVLFGKYLVQGKLGEGAMGEVWLVRHRELGIERALKLINLARFSDPEMRARARREARAMALFSHPNAVTVHDANADGDLAYIEMEYIRGRSLNKVLRPGTPMPVAWVAEIVQQICAALEVAHSHGIVHRDLKPSNMMLLGDEPQPREHLKILDFGIAKILHNEDQGGDDLRTWSGAVIGTPAYMSPEQINTEAGQLDGRSDLYTLGVILFEMLTGRRPFTSASFRLTFDHLHTLPPPFSDVNPDNDVPAEIEQLVRRCLEKDPKLRPRSARELGEEFRRLATPPEPEVEPVAPPRRRGATWAAVGAVAALTALVSVWAFRTPFSIDASPLKLRLRAGDETRLAIVAQGVGRGAKASVVPVDLPGWLKVTPEGGGSSSGLTEFRVSPGFDAPIGPFALRFRGKAGNVERTATVTLTIDATVFSVPPGFSPAAGSVPVRDNGKVYHSRIVPATAGAEAEFLFVRKTHPGEPESFYIMKDKVSNALFARFEQSNPAAARKSAIDDHRKALMEAAREAVLEKGGKLAQQQARKAAQQAGERFDPQPFVKDLLERARRRELEQAKQEAVQAGKNFDSEGFLRSFDQWPARHVSADDAYRFAEWLGQGKVQVKLPTLAQWDKASGYYDKPRGTGPFLATWKPDRGGIAIGKDRKFPAPVGSSRDDVSPYGCRDMAGNGVEWTRNTMTEGVLLPLAPGDVAMVLLRGVDCSSSMPFQFLMVDDRDNLLAARSNDWETNIAFRLVIDEL